MLSFGSAAALGVADGELVMNGRQMESTGEEDHGAPQPLLGSCIRSMTNNEGTLPRYTHRPV